MKNPYTIGKKVYLRHPTIQDAEGAWHEWLSDEETTRWLGLRNWPNSVEKQKEFYEKSIQTQERLILSIIDISTNDHIGICSLSSINWVHRYCDIAIIIGKKKFRKGPHYLEAMSLLLRTAFLRLNLRLVKSAFVSSNEATKVMHQLFRFNEVGRIPKMYWDKGEYVDYIIAALGRSEWLKKNNIKK